MTNPTDPITLPPTTRAVQVAALHSVAAFLADYPNLPDPAAAEINAYNVPYLTLQELAERHHTEFHHRGRVCWVTIPLTVESLHGITINYNAHGEIPPTSPMDVPPRGEGVITDPWADVMPAPRGRCEKTWPGPENGRCVKPADHADLCFFDDDETNGAHGA
jgi:hypothetical protein